MGYSKENSRVRIVNIRLQYRYLFNGDGEPLVFEFPVRIDRLIDKQIEETERALGNGERLSSAHKLSRVIAGEPLGFDDFPTGTPADLPERIIKYFSAPEESHFAEDALLGRQNTIYPVQLFRGSQDSSLASDLSSKASAGAT